MASLALLPHGTTAASPIASYDFPCIGSRVLSTSFADTTGNSLLGELLSNEKTFRCSPFGTGITPLKDAAPRGNAPLLVSEESTQRLIQQHHSTRKMSIELWFTPGVEESDVAPILSFSAPHFDSLKGPCDAHVLKIMQRPNNELYVALQGWDVCDLKTFGFQSTGLTQLIATLEDDKPRKFYINGQDLGIDLGLQFNLASWDQSMYLQLFPGYGPELFSGSIHRFSLHDQVIPNAATSYEAGKLELEHQAKPLFAPSTIQDGMIPSIKGLPSVLKPVFSTKVELFQSDFVTTNLTLKGVSNLSPSDSNGWWVAKAKIVLIPTRGVFMTTEHKLVQANDTLDLVWDPADHVYYTAPLTYTLQDATYFNIPQLGNMTPETFAYRIVFVDAETGEDLAWSNSSEHQIKVEHINKPPTLNAEGAYFRRVGGHAYLEGTITFQAGDQVELNPLRVTVETQGQGGAPQLFLNHTKAEFKKCGKWDGFQCNGPKDKSLTFLAYASDVVDILLELEVIGEVSTNVTIRIYDGEGGACLKRRYQLGGGKDTFGEDRCYSVAWAIPVNVAPGRNVKERGSKARMLLTFLCVVVVVAILIMLGALYCQRKKAHGSNRNHVGDSEKTSTCSEPSPGSGWNSNLEDVDGESHCWGIERKCT